MGCNCGGSKKSKPKTTAKNDASRIQKRSSAQQKRMVAIKAINKTLSKKD